MVLAAWCWAGLGAAEQQLADHAEQSHGAQYRRAVLPAGPLPYRPYTLCPGDQGWIIEDAWPTLYFGPERCAEIKRKAAALPWAAKTLALMREEAELVLAQPPQLPLEPCGWRHDFFSRATGAHLRYEPDRADAFLDPTTGRREADAAQRRAWALLTHERTFRLMRSLGVLYQVTGDERYARWVAEGLRLAADYFGHREFRTKDALYFSALYDAGVLLLLGNAYELTRDSPSYSLADHERMRQGIFEERMPSLLAYLEKAGTHNIACFVAAAVARTGKLLGRPDWVELGLAGPAGLHRQLLGGVAAARGQVDGFWGEGTTFYHFYALCPLVTLWELERELGRPVDPELQQRLQAMFAVPLALVDGDLRLPSLGDLGIPGHMSLAAYRHLYEYAAGRLDQGRFGPALAALYRHLDAPRTDLAALAYGPDRLPDPDLPTGHALLPVAGMGVFRAQAPAPCWLLFRAGKYHRGHDHPDRLSVCLSAYGELVSPDLGEPGYSLRPRHGNYYRATVAHNTMFVDEADLPADAELDWRPQAEPPQARGRAVADGVALERTVFFDPPYIVILDRYQCDRERRFGWVYHARGRLTCRAPVLAAGTPAALGLPPLPQDGPWANLTGRRSGVADGACAATWQVAPRVRLHLLTAAEGPFEITSAVTPGNPYADRQGALLLRALRREWTVCTVLEVAPGAASAAAVALGAQDEVTVRLKDGSTKRYRWTQG